MLCLRHATPDDLDAIEELETVSFPPEEAADRTRLQERLAIYPECFWLLFDEKKLLAYSCGLATECRVLLTRCTQMPPCTRKTALGRCSSVSARIPCTGARGLPTMSFQK